MTEHEIRPECEHRMTEMETLLKNHIPHVEARLSKIEKILWTIAAAAISGIFGLVVFLIKGHITFR